MLPQLLLCSLGLIGFIETAQIVPLHDLFNTSQRYAFIQNDGLTNVYHGDNLGIVNGQPARRRQFCFAVYLQISDGPSLWSCTGSLVTETVILTAAHCLDGAVNGTAVLGAADLKKAKDPGVQILKFEKDAITIHGKYNPKKVVNDIGIIRLKENVKLDKKKFVCTVKLPKCSATKEPVSESDTLTVLGWGKTSDSTSTSRLMYAKVHGQEQNYCAYYYKKVAQYTVVGSQMCTSGADGKSTCNGDSGGPLLNKGVQKGIVSLGLHTCEAKAPSVYTDLTCFMDWLCPLINKK